MKTKLVRLVGTIAAAVGIVGLLLLMLSSASAAPSATLTYTWTDDFSTSTLDTHWSWVREDATHWSLTEHPGFLRITTQQGGLLGPGGDAKNLLVRDAPVGGFEIETRVFFTPTENFQIAGLLVYQDDDNFLMLGRAYCGFVPPCVGNGIYFDHEEQGNFVGSNYAMTTTLLGEAYLRIVRHGTVYTGYVSENGTNWTLVGAHTVVSGLVPSKVGLAAEPSYQDVTEIPADFDYLRLDDNSYRVLLPLMLRNY